MASLGDSFAMSKEKKEEEKDYSSQVFTSTQMIGQKYGIS